MLKRYEKFLGKFNLELEEYFESQKQYIKCKKGCNDCCSVGEYPFSRLEMEYLMQGVISLDNETRNLIRKNVDELKEQKKNFKGERFLYKCPFLINGLCSLYERRGLTCRVFGLAWLKDDNKMILPECANFGLNYSENFKSGVVTLENPIKKKLTITDILTSDEAKKFDLECGEIRPLIDWF